MVKKGKENPKISATMKAFMVDPHLKIFMTDDKELLDNIHDAAEEHVKKEVEGAFRRAYGDWIDGMFYGNYGSRLKRVVKKCLVFDKKEKKILDDNNKKGA